VPQGFWPRLPTAARCAARRRPRTSADELGILGRTLDDDVARPVERRLGIGHVLAKVGRGGLFGDERRVGEQLVGERLEARLAGNLRLGAPLGLVWQVDVLDPGLGVGRQQRGAQLVGELALLFDGGQHRVPALVEFAQVVKALRQHAQLTVVETTRDLLAVPRDEGHGRTLV
jgi:hypothetical protein